MFSYNKFTLSIPNVFSIEALREDFRQARSAEGQNYEPQWNVSRKVVTSELEPLIVETSSEWWVCYQTSLVALESRMVN